jgi:hypothetical protein
MGLADKVISVESAGDANAKNPRSTATGAGQFIEETWLDMLAKHRPDITGSRDELLALRTNKDLSREMTDAYAADNGGILKGAGLPVTPGTQYLAHFAGPKGAVGLLNADPSAPASSVLRPSAIKANPFLANMSAGDVAAWADRKMGGPSAPMSMAGPRPAAPAVAAPAVAPTAAPAAVAAAAPAAPAAAPFQFGGGGGGGGMSLAALGATPQLTNLLSPRPNVFGLKTAPFSLRG